MDAADMAMVLSLVVGGLVGVWLGWEVAGVFSGRSLRCAWMGTLAALGSVHVPRLGVCTHQG